MGTIVVGHRQAQRQRNAILSTYNPEFPSNPTTASPSEHDAVLSVISAESALPTNGVMKRGPRSTG